MNYNKLTLSFPDKEETNFRKKYFDDSIIQFRIAFVLVIILYAAFGYLDTKIETEFTYYFKFIRFYFVIPFLSFVLLFSFFTFFRKVWQILIFLSYIVGGLGIIAMIYLAPDNYPYYLGVMLVFFAGYFFIKLRFVLALAAGWIIIIVFNITLLTLSPEYILFIVKVNFFYISANIIGMVGAYNIEYYIRNDFFLKNELDKQTNIIEDINKNLEQTIVNRTKELIIAKNQAEESDKLKTAFLEIISHEIRTPMNGILGFSDLLKNPELTDELQFEYIKNIKDSSSRMLTTIHNIVEIAKIESGSYECVYNNLNISSLIDSIAYGFKEELDRKGLRLKIINMLPTKETTIFTDSKTIQAILSNLIQNAIKFTSKGYVEVGCNKKDDITEFYVKDTGIGIPISKQKIIFERFVQGDIVNSEAVQGTGLGLAIANSFVNILKGKIWVSSIVGEGSTFYFSIPDYKETYN